MNTLQDKIRGSLIGGAIGDALGYPVEFIYSFEGIQARYAKGGLPVWIQNSIGWMRQNRLVRLFCQMTLR